LPPTRNRSACPEPGDAQGLLTSYAGDPGPLPCALSVTGRGLSVSSLDASGAPEGPPVVVAWRRVQGFRADGTEAAPDGSVLQVLEITTDEGTLRVLAPAWAVSVLLGRVATHATRWRWSRTRAAEVVSGVEDGLAPVRRGVLAAADAVAGATVGAASVVWRAADALWWWIESWARAAGPPLVSLLGEFGRAVHTSVVGLAARAAARSSGRAARAVASWAVAVARAVLIPLAALLGVAGRALLELSAPARRWFGATVVGLALADGVRRLRARAERLAAGAGELHRRRGPIPLLAGLSSVLLVTASMVALVASGPVTEAAAHGQGSASSLALSAVAANDVNTSSMATVAAVLRGDGKSLNLPRATAPPAAAPASVTDEPPLRPHEVFGFAPYWTLPQSGGFDVGAMTTLAYFSVDANPDGSLVESGAGWNGFESQALADLVTRAHAAGDRVVLTVTCFDQGALDAITSDPSAPARLSAAVVAAIAAKNLDGVNIDFEGNGSADQNGLTNLVSAVSTAVHTANPHDQVTMDTYASSAGDPGGFYNVKALAPAVDGFFVMSYQLNLSATPSATSPLTSTMFSDLTTAKEYTAAVSGSKVILGTPFYGYDWPTTDGTLTAQATGGAVPITYGQVVASGHPIYWDPVTNTAWTSYQDGGQWHEDFFENPQSLYLEAQLAQSFGLDGVGIWALGMDGNDPSMVTALDGFAPPLKVTDTGPASTAASSPATTTTTAPPPTTTTAPPPTTTTAPPPTTTTAPPTTTTTTPTYTYTGVWSSTSVTLTRAAPGVLGPPHTFQVVGQLTGFSTSDPAVACLESAPSLMVWELDANPSDLVAGGTAPADCTTAYFTFNPSNAPIAPTSSTRTTATTTLPHSS